MKQLTRNVRAVKSLDPETFEAVASMYSQLQNVSLETAKEMLTRNVRLILGSGALGKALGVEAP